VSKAFLGILLGILIGSSNHPAKADSDSQDLRNCRIQICRCGQMVDMLMWEQVQHLGPEIGPKRGSDGIRICEMDDHK